MEEVRMKGKPEFHQDFISKRIDPMHTAHVDFPFDEVQNALDGKGLDSQETAAELVRRIFLWVTDVNMGARRKRKAQELTGRRFIALAWVLDPSLFNCSPSATDLSKQIGIKCAPSFQQLTGEASRMFGISNYAQRHAWNNGKTGDHPTQPPDATPGGKKESFFNGA